MTSPLLFSLALACSGGTAADSGTTHDTGTTGTGDSAETPDTATPEVAAVPTGVAAEVSPHVGTVVRVTWSVDGAGSSWVVWDGGQSAVVDNTSGAGEVLLVGLDPDTVLSLVVRSEAGDDGVESDPISVTTGPLHPDLPMLDVTVHTDDAADGWVLGSTKNGTPGAFVLDRTGRIVWWHVGDYLYGHLVPTADGLLYLGSAPGGRSLRLISWWGDEVSSVTLPDAHHAFGLKSDGSVSFIATDKRAWDTVGLVAGDAIRHLDGDGVITDTWNVWDVLEPVPSPNWDSPYYSDAEDWTHANGIDLDPADDTALVTFTNIDALALIDLSTGVLLEGSELLGGSWTTAPGEAFDFPHDVHRLDAETLLLTTNSDGETLAAEYSLVEGVWARTWAYGSTEPVSTNAGGAAQRLENGNTLIGWGRSAFVEEVTRDGEPVWVASFLRNPALGTFSALETGPWATAQIR